MNGVSAPILAMIRNAGATFLSDTCTIEAPTSTTTAYGSVSQTWVTVAEDEPCRILLAGNRYSSEARTAGEQETLRQQYKLIVARDVGLAVDYRVTDSADNVYDVIQVETALTDEPWHSAILARR